MIVLSDENSHDYSNYIHSACCTVLQITREMISSAAGGASLRSWQPVLQGFFCIVILYFGFWFLSH